jgi:crotonobetainyl-CoA:carnitine CoA-transferase CaiB-like acyl-CoA transferase
MSQEDNRRPRIVDFSTHLSGPICSHLLVETGANVIKVENPRTGDGNRGVTPLIADVGNLHVALGPGTRSIAVDRRSEHWPRVVDAAARWADAVIIGARPRDAVERGLGFERFRASNPRIVYCLISGYGEHGPWANLAAHGQCLDAFAGLARFDWVDGRPVTTDGWRSTGTTLAGVYAAFGVMAGLYAVARGSSAQYVHVSIWGAVMSWQWRDLNTLANLGERWPEYRDLGSRYCLYATRDNRAILFAPLERKFWETFCDLIGLSERRTIGDWSSGMEYGGGEFMEEERTMVADRIRERTMDEWVQVFLPTDVPFAPLVTIDEALHSEQTAANGVMAATEVNGRTLRVPASPVTVRDDNNIYLGRAPGEPLASPPTIGEDTDDVLCEFGLEDLRGVL